MGDVTLGHDVRHWTVYEVADLTKEEAEILEGEDDRALELFKSMLESGRAIEREDSHDDMPTLFEESDVPAIVGVVLE